MEVVEERKAKDTDAEVIEIRLNDIVWFLKANFGKVLIGGIVGMIIGAMYGFSKPDIYKVEATIMPELQNRSMGNLGAISAFSGLGFDNTNTNDAIRPDLYPNVLQSVPFALDLLKQPVYSKKLNAKTTLQEFFERTSTPSYLDKILSSIATKDDDNKVDKSGSKNGVEAIQLTKEQYGLVKTVQGSVTPMYDKKTGILTVTTVASDPMVAASVAQLSLNYLTNYITAYRTDKARKHVVFLIQQVREAKQRYQAAEYALSNYRDRNRSVFLNTAKLDEQRLQADYLLEQSVYNDLAKQLEQAKIKVQEDTPTFKALDPPAVPLFKSGPKRTLIMFGCAFVGVIIALSVALTRQVMIRK